MRSLEEETKFHSMNRSPSGSPPSSITVEGSSASKAMVSTGAKIAIWPTRRVCPSTSTEPLAT